MLPGERGQIPTQVIFEWLRNGGSTEMAVDGSGTTQVFTYEFNSNGKDIKILNVQLNISGAKLDDPEFFGGLPAALTNGIELGFLKKDANGSQEEILGVFKNNYEMLAGSSSSKPWGFTKDARDVMVVKFFEDYDICLPAFQYTGIYLKVKDDLTALHSMNMAIRGYST